MKALMSSKQNSEDIFNYYV